MESTVLEQISSIQAVAKVAVIGFSGGAGRDTEPSPDIKILSVIRTVVSRAVVKGFRIAAFYSAVEEALQKLIPKFPSVDAVAAKLINVTFFTVPVASFE